MRALKLLSTLFQLHRRFRFFFSLLVGGTEQARKLHKYISVSKYIILCRYVFYVFMYVNLCLNMNVTMKASGGNECVDVGKKKKICE